MSSHLSSASDRPVAGRTSAARPGNSTGSDKDAVALWAAVVLQARVDIEMEPLDSIDYAQAVHFFTGRGEWAHSRATIADFLNMHPDDVERAGRTCIDQRRAKEGLPPLAKPVRSRPARSVPHSLPAKPVSVSLVQPTHVAASNEQRRTPRIGRAKGSNPFFPRGIPDLSEFREAA